MRVRAGIVDHGAGNVRSVEHALRWVGAEPVLVARPAELVDVDLLVMPGVGSAAPAMARLRRRGLVGPVRAWLAADRPYLGICLGLQLLFEGSDEDGAATFGVLSGRTQQLRDAPTLPHVGWNQVVRRRAHPLFDGLAADADFYFVHSYAGGPRAEATELVLAETTHGATFVSAVGRGNTWGVQFHPERSADNGLRLLANAVALAARAMGVSGPGAAEASA
ncbi:MAG TPA: imidazole glycerol phosphate synthase subunit HisH [Candidatus Limnocylindrales bacterium]|nr:imidazole glycerol phosphate synthase subunit HisH [Candidatus Limnocylindrales bacterium]